MRRSAARFAFTSLSVAGLALSCGSRTELLSIDQVSVDAAIDAPDTSKDARVDVISDVRVPDVLPPIDVQVDSPKPPPVGCFDAGATQIYVITSARELLAFYPPTLSFTTIGTINCPGAGGDSPFSMAVSRSGTAYTVFNNGLLFRLSTGNASCASTSFKPGQQGFTTFGMGYAGDQNTESLYVSDNVGAQGLASIDTTSFVLSTIGAYVPAIPPRCEMTGTGDGRLFAYCINDPGPGGIVAQIDRTSAKVIAADPVKVGKNGDGFAFAFWGGEFYMFNTDGPSTVVTRYDPLTKSEAVVATTAHSIVGAGVSTCAPP